MILCLSVFGFVRSAILILGGALALAASGCAQVKPYQREKLAHPTMLLVDHKSPGAAHTYAIQEGATGGSSAVEGGCGCN